MFERNKVDNTGHQVQPFMVSAEITLSDTGPLSGKIAVPGTKTLAEHLNSAAPFVEFEPFGGERVWIAKAALRQIKILNVSGPQSLPRAAVDDAFEPYAVLKVARNASWDDVRAAYLKLAKTYHPDRFTGLDLPAEMKEYVEATARRINAAYSVLEGSFEAQKRVQQKAQPIYTSRPAA